MLTLGEDRTNRMERGPQGWKVGTQQRGINEPRRTLFTNEGCDSSHSPPPLTPLLPLTLMVFPYGNPMLCLSLSLARPWGYGADSPLC